MDLTEGFEEIDGSQNRALNILGRYEWERVNLCTRPTDPIVFVPITTSLVGIFVLKTAGPEESIHVMVLLRCIHGLIEDIGDKTHCR